MKCLCRFLPLMQPVWFVVPWEGTTQQYFGFPVLPEIEGLKYMATADGKRVGDNRHPPVLSPQQLSVLSPRARKTSYWLCFVQT